MWKLESSLPLVKDSDYLNIENAYSRLMNNEKLGFKNIETIDASIKSCNQYKEYLSSFDHMVVIGLGGSSLGTKAFCDSLYYNIWPKKITFLDNVDSFSVDEFLSKITTPKKIGWVLCSKSGATIEVLSLFEYCHSVIEEKFNFSITNQSLIVTEFKSSPLYNFAKKNDLPLLKVPEQVGGRFSVFTPIGFLPLQFLNFNMEKAKLGFSEVLENKELVCQLSYFLFQSRHATSFYSFQYCNKLSQWSLWLQQLWSESLSKSVTVDGKEAIAISTFVPCRGVSDQHSVLQQIIEGHESKIVGFHQVKSSEKSQSKIKKGLFESSLMENKGLGDLMRIELLATAEAVRASGSQTFMLTTEELTTESVSYLMGLWMLTIGVLGEAFNVNAFNQPGVESGKIIARKSLSQLKR